MSAGVESITRALRMLPPAAVQEVAEFTDYLLLKHVRPALDEHTARRRANRWVVERVGNMAMADRCKLTQSEGRPVWRCGVYVTSLVHEPKGPIGTVEVDATSGEILGDDALVREIIGSGISL